MKILVYWMEKKAKDCRNKGILSEYSEVVLFSNEREEEIKSSGSWSLFQRTLYTEEEMNSGCLEQARLVSLDRY